MKIARIRDRAVLGALGVFAALSLGAGCPLIPEINEKVVELVATGSTTVPFDAIGIINVHDETNTIDVRDDLDLVQLLDDAGIDVSDVKSISVAGVSYRVIQLDPTANRRIENGNVTVARGSGPENTIISNFDADVNASTAWQTAPVSSAGITLMNALLADLLTEAQTGIPASNTDITYRVTGNSTPANVATDFRWEIRLTVSIVGEVRIDVVE